MIGKILQNIINNETGRLFAAITLVNAGNYLINLLLGRFLGPADFAEAGILATMVLILSFIAIGIQMTAARFVAALWVDNKEAQLKGFKSWVNKKTLGLGLVLSILLGLGTPVLKDFLHFRSAWPILIIVAGIPVYFLLSAHRGFLQGRQQFRPFARSYFAEMFGRLAITAIVTGVVWYFSSGRFSEAVALGFLASFILGFKSSQQKTEPGKVLTDFGDKKKMLTFFGLMMMYEGTQIAISYSDIILVKHYFSDFQAGLYAALSLVGRIVYFATWAVVMMLVPQVVQKEKQGLPHHHLFLTSFLWIAATGLVITTGCALFSGWIVQLLFGTAYAGIGALLWKYSLATTLFACANVFAYYHLSLGRYIPVTLSALAGFLQILFITFYHDSVNQIIHIQIGLMTGLLVSMIAYHLVKTTENENCTRFSVSPE